MNKRKFKRQNDSAGYKLPNFNATEKFLFKYSTVINRSTTVSINNLYTFRLNSLYDPDYTGAGKQPYLFDQVALLWTYYRVDKAKVLITASNTTTLPVTTVVFYQPSTSTQSDSFDYFQQLPNAKSQLLGPANSGTSVHKFKPFYVVPHRIMGLPKSDDTLRASYSNNPESVIYLFIGNQCEDLSTSNTVYYNVSIEFYTTMSGQYQQGDSLFESFIPRLLESDENIKKLRALLDKDVVVQSKQQTKKR